MTFGYVYTTFGMKLSGGKESFWIIQNNFPQTQPWNINPNRHVHEQETSSRKLRGEKRERFAKYPNILQGKDHVTLSA